MLGKLGMSADQYLRAYKKMAEQTVALKWGPKTTEDIPNYPLTAALGSET